MPTQTTQPQVASAPTPGFARRKARLGFAIRWLLRQRRRQMGFNSLPETRFEDIKRVLRVALSCVTTEAQKRPLRRWRYAAGDACRHCSVFAASFAACAVCFSLRAVFRVCHDLLSVFGFGCNFVCEARVFGGVMYAPPVLSVGGFPDVVTV